MSPGLLLKVPARRAAATGGRVTALAVSGKQSEKPAIIIERRTRGDSDEDAAHGPTAVNRGRHRRVEQYHRQQFARLDA